MVPGSSRLCPPGPASGRASAASAWGLSSSTSTTSSRFSRRTASRPRIPPSRERDWSDRLKLRVVTRGNTREMFVGDPAGIVFQLHDVSYCGGSGPLGNMCQPEPAPTKGLLAVKDMSHFTVSAPQREFYPGTFGCWCTAMQATTPGYTVLDRAFTS